MLIESAVSRWTNSFDDNSREEDHNDRIGIQCNDKPAINLTEEIKVTKEPLLQNFMIVF